MWLELSFCIQNTVNLLTIYIAPVDFTEAESTDTAKIYYSHILWEN